jgi:catechol 2,3-dioxygenase-like lactoylglutathione lyase family enzyme
MAAQLVAVSFEVPDPAVTAAFWAALLGRETVDESAGVLVPGDATQVGLQFVPATTEKPGSNRLHLHLTCASDEEQRALVDAVLRSGGRRRGSRPLPIGRDLYVADPSGDEFCVIEPGNTFLAGCGLLGEVTCEGTPAAGRFWRDALGWSLVWDQDDQTAIQSPAGGTKLSWDGPARADAPGWNRQRFVLAAPDLGAEVDRLTGLGAVVLTDRGDAVLMADPDGSELLLRLG